MVLVYQPEGVTKMMTAQEIFDKVATHLLTQKVKSHVKIPTGCSTPGQENYLRCSYRGENGTSCAVGCLISDDDYSPRMEGAGSGDLLAYFPRACANMVGHANLLYSLQAVHDSSEPCKWREQLKLVADRYELNDSVVDTTPE
jgi:hypothetical protein